ncbi:MAG: hypothetical protein H7Y15_14835 [Pseudonocardia sp.]|nr:hypothetical protein [Pseudonocardia sp.]
MAATRRTTGQSAISTPRVTVASRLSGKKTSQMVVACFQRGGGAGAVTTAYAVSGASNQPSMPVRRSVRVTSASPCADPSHQRRSGRMSRAPGHCGTGAPNGTPSAGWRPVVQVLDQANVAASITKR